MNTFILTIPSLDCHILLPLNKSIMGLTPIALGGLEILGISVNLNISDKDLTDLAYSDLSSHLREKLESPVFSDVSQVLQMALDCESRGKESRSFTRRGDKLRNDCPINMVEYDSESSDDEKADMCVAEWNWASKSKPFVCSSLKPASKSQ
jgi:hypothetical protein